MNHLKGITPSTNDVKRNIYDCFEILYKISNDGNISLNSSFFLAQAYVSRSKSPHNLFKRLYGYNCSTSDNALIRRLTNAGLINQPNYKQSSILTQKGRELVSKYI